MITLIAAATASAISVGAAVLSSRKALQAQRIAAQYVTDAKQYSESAQTAVLAAQAHSESASRAALASKTHASVSFAHCESAKKVAQQPLVTVTTEPEPRKSRRDLIREAAHAPEVQQRIDEINEHRARTSPLIPGNDPEAQTDPMKWRARQQSKKF